MISKLLKPCRFIFVLLLLTPIFWGCSSSPDLTNLSAKELLQLARNATDVAKYDDAIKYYDQIEARFPYSVFSRQALLDQAFSYYQQSEDQKALVTIERFIKLYPEQVGIDYAYYLKGMVYYGKGRGIIDFLIEASTAKRDLDASKNAYNSFAKIVKDYPNSQYAGDAKTRLDLLYNQMAQYEVNLARYYLDKKAYVAAINRASKSIADYNQSIAQEEALAIMVNAYNKLGLEELRNQTLSILKLNYPQTKFTELIAGF